MNDRELVTPTEQLVAEAIDAGDRDRAKRLLNHMVTDWRRNADYSINWITTLLSFIGRSLGEDAVEEALRDFGERYLKSRRSGALNVEPRKRMEAIVRGMKGNGADVQLSEDRDKYVLSFRCGSGGKLIDEGAYGAPRNYLTLREAGPRTFGRPELPVYCAHCSVNNEMQAIEMLGAPVTVEFPPEKPGDRCIHHVYKDPRSIPDDVFERVGKTPPG